MFGIDKSQDIVNFADFEISQLGDALLYGGTMLLIGMATIFAVLCLLWGCLTVFKIVFHDIPEKKANHTAVKEVAPAPAPVASAPVAEEGEIVAVIAAAIAMAESESSGLKFKVVSFKRK